MLLCIRGTIPFSRRVFFANRYSLRLKTLCQRLRDLGLDRVRRRLRIGGLNDRSTDHEIIGAGGVEISALAIPQCCISAAVASVMRDAGATQVMVAASADENALFEALDRALRS